MGEKFKIFLTSGLIGLIRNKQLPPEEMNKRLKGAYRFWGIVGSVFLLVLLMIFFVALSPAKCADIGCFITKADQCRPVTYKETTDMGIIDYSVKSGANNSCILTKQIAGLNRNENGFLKKVLEKKQMNCTYSKGEFNGQWLTSMIEGLDNCSGDLKNVIGQLLILVK